MIKEFKWFHLNCFLTFLINLINIICELQQMRKKFKIVKFIDIIMAIGLGVISLLI